MAELRLEITKRDPNNQGKHLAIFLHGLGAPETWVSEKDDWKQVFLEDRQLQSVDIGIVTYDTAHLLSDFLNQVGLHKIPFGKHQLTVKNSQLDGIEMLAREFSDEMDRRPIRSYDKIVLVGHSMGGLIALRYLLEQVELENPRVNGYVSLATPFNGADMAVFHKVIQRWHKHVQIADLSPNSKFLDDTMRLLQKHRQKNTPALEQVQFRYCFGKEDDIVKEQSAVPLTDWSLWKSAVPLPGDHGGILSLPQGQESKAYVRVQEAILDVIDPISPSTPPNQGRGEGTSSQGGASASAGTVVQPNSAFVTANYSPVDLLKSFDLKMDQFVGKFPPDLQNVVQQARLNVLEKIAYVDPNDFREFCFRHRFPINRAHDEEVAILDIWKILTLLQMSFPEWSLRTDEEIANLYLEDDVWRRWIYSVEEETMPDLLLQLAKKRLQGASATSIKIGDVDLFPHRLILENCNRDVAEENICEHCRRKNEISFERILRDTGRAGELTIFKGVQPNGFSSLDKVKVTCANCIRGVRVAKTLDDLRIKIRKVV